MVSKSKQFFHGLVKGFGAVLWPVAILALLLFWPLGVLLLIVAIILSITSLIWTRQARHEELLEATEAGARAVTQAVATQQASPPSPTTAPTATDRLRELQSLHEQGLVTDDEFEAKRQAIVNEM